MFVVGQYLPNPRQRFLRDRENPLELFSNVHFYRWYRFSKDTVVDLTNTLFANVAFKQDRNFALTPIQRVCVFLRFASFGSEQLIVGDTAQCSQPTVSRIVAEMSQCAANHVKDYVKFPTGEEAQQIQQGFFAIAGKYSSSIASLLKI